MKKSKDIPAKKIRPLGDRVVLEPVTQEEKTQAGIYLPDTADKEKPEEGKVVAVGPGRRNLKGEYIPMDIKKGERVIFSKYGPTEIKIEGKEYLVAKEEDILGILE